MLGVLLLGMAKRELRRAVDPRRVEVVRLNGRVVEEEVLSATGNYLFIYLLIFIIMINGCAPVQLFHYTTDRTVCDIDYLVI